MGYYMLTFNRARIPFNDFISSLMNPYPGPHVLVMDNVSIHKSQQLAQMCHERGVMLEFLPPYSPDFNPIEEAFSAIKQYLRRHHDFVDNELLAEPRYRATDLLLHAVFTVTEQQSRGWFRHSGYI